MIKKRLLCILLAICLLIPMSLPTYAASESNELKNVTLSLYSNLSPERYISGLYRDNTFYITLEDLCALTRGKIVKETEEEAVVSFGNCRNGKSIREFVIDVGSGNMAETLHSDKYNITLPSLIQDGKVYVSALHFLRYLGATVKLQEDAPIQFMVIKRYDIFDALSDLINSDLGNFFWWDEVDTGEENLEDKLTNAGVIALIDRDSNIFRMMFDAKGIEQEALEDALLSIVKNEGQGYFVENSAESELIDTASGIIGAEADWFGLIKDSYADGSDVLGKQIDKLASVASTTAGLTNNVIAAFESLKQFDNMSVSQRDLLEKTILEYSKDSKTLCDGWDVVFDASKNISEKIQSEYYAQYNAALDILESTAYDFLNGATGAAGANPVSIAWSSVTLLTKMIPFTNEMIEKKEQLYNSYNCSIIQLIANEMLVEAYSDWYYGNALYTGSAEQYKKLDAVKQLIVLQLKSTLTTREYLINSGFLESNYASEMKEMNQETALLLNKVENCQINGVALFTSEYNEDLSWIQNYADYATPLFEQLVTEYGYADNTIETVCYSEAKEEENRASASSVVEVPSDNQIGIIFKAIRDFDQNGVPDLFIILLDDHNGELCIIRELYMFEPGGVSNNSISVTTLPCNEKTNFYFYMQGNYFVWIEEDDSSDDWSDDNTLFYRVKEGNTQIHHNEIYIYDFGEQDYVTGSGAILYINKDFRRSESAVCYTVDTPADYYAVYSDGFTLTSADTKHLLPTEDNGCSYIYNVTSKILSDAVGKLVPVTWENRWQTSFFPGKNDLSEYAILEIETAPSRQISETTTVSNVLINGEYTIK